tara:strand:+ start:60 stop:212 length:153 start_codon:yes stop_codon:yes gene_type:complete
VFNHEDVARSEHNGSMREHATMPGKACGKVDDIPAEEVINCWDKLKVPKR